MSKRRGSLAEESTPLLDGQQCRDEGPSSTPHPTTSTDDLDMRFKRWLDYIAGRHPRRAKGALEKAPQFLFSVFMEQEREAEMSHQHVNVHWEGNIQEKDFANQVASVKGSIGHGLHPRMIQTGSSGSYFVQACLDDKGDILAASASPDAFTDAIENKRTALVAVFKPSDEEPYGDQNPKRVFLRRYFWWAMGRPCLIPGFSYLSEVGASLLDDRLKLSLVPTTRLVYLSSKAFSYPVKEAQQGVFREKVGSYQNFLRGYVNVSTFLRMHPWPSRPRNLLEQDLEAENHAHGRKGVRSHKGKGNQGKKKSRGCLSFCKSLSCFSGTTHLEETPDQTEVRRSMSQAPDSSVAFSWTKELMQAFRLELEKLVCLDYLMRNTDRGLDNFMVKVEETTPCDTYPSGWKLTLAAIDNSLAFPWKHPAGIRSYPQGWLYLPTDLIGGNFSRQTKDAFVPYLSSAAWWNDTKSELEKLFRRDDHFDEKKFEGQMEVLRGQGWNLLESLRSEEEGPLELCARQKQLVKQQNKVLEERDLTTLSGAVLPFTYSAQIIDRKLNLSGKESTGTGKDGTPARPIAMPLKETIGSTSDSDAFHPRSLPDSIDEEQIAQRWHQSSVIDDISRKDKTGRVEPVRMRSSEDVQEDKAIGKAYRGKSLGIEVLAEIDKSVNKARRPKLRKAFTGHSSRNAKSKMQKRRERESRSDNIREAEEDIARPSRQTDQPRPPLLKYRRRRNGSVGDNWSISSVFDRSESNEAPETGSTRVQVVIEHLEADDGVAWQTYLGLQ